MAKSAGGTEFYLGNKLGYRHYKVAEGVEEIYSNTFADAGETVMPENPAYRIALKATVDGAVNDYNFMGNLLLYGFVVVPFMFHWQSISNCQTILSTYQHILLLLPVLTIQDRTAKTGKILSFHIGI